MTNIKTNISAPRLLANSVSASNKAAMGGGPSTEHQAAAVPSVSPDIVQISAESSAASSNFSSVKVDAWGQGSNDHLVGILLNNGYTADEIYGGGVLKKVAEQNGLKNPNLIQAGATLKIPNKPTSTDEQELSATAEPSPSEAGSLEKMNLFADLSNTEIHQFGLDHRRQGLQNLDQMFGAISSLPDGELKNSIRKGLTYQMASDSGLFGSGDKNLTPDEIQGLVSQGSPEQKAAFEQRVGEWAMENPVLSQRSMAIGAASAAGAGYSMSLPLESQESLLEISKSANGVLFHNDRASLSMVRLHERSPEAGMKLAEQIVNMSLE